MVRAVVLLCSAPFIRSALRCADTHGICFRRSTLAAPGRVPTFGAHRFRACSWEYCLQLVRADGLLLHSPPSMLLIVLHALSATTPPMEHSSASSVRATRLACILTILGAFCLSVYPAHLRSSLKRTGSRPLHARGIVRLQPSHVHVGKQILDNTPVNSRQPST
jgi:hypothetical protein